MSLLSDANPDMNPWLIIVLGLLVSCTIGALFGLLNGIAVAKFHIAPFIITLASQLLAMGLCYVFTNGYTVSGGPRELSRLSTLTGIHIGKTIIPMAAIIPIVIFILMAVVLSKTTFGRQVILTGSNPKSAEHAGISVSRIYIIVYLLSGVFAGIAAMFIPMCIGGVNPDVGANLLMPMVAAVTIGRDQPVRRLRQHGAGRLRHPVHHVPDERNDLPGLRPADPAARLRNCNRVYNDAPRLHREKAF